MDKPWKVVFAFVGVFIAGAVFGGFFTLRTSGKRFANDAGGGRASPGLPRGQATRAAGATAAGQSSAVPGQPNQAQAGRIAPALMNQFTKRLSPTAEQKEKIRPIVSRASEDIQRLQREHLQDTTRVSERMYEDVAALLTPEQRMHLEKMRQEMLERVRKEREKRGEIQAKSGSPRANAPAQPAQPNSKPQQGP